MTCIYEVPAGVDHDDLRAPGEPTTTDRTPLRGGTLVRVNDGISSMYRKRRWAQQVRCHTAQFRFAALMC